MANTVRRIGLIGVSLLVVGALLVGGGVYLERLNPCQSGYRLDIRPLETAGAAQPVALADLPAPEQRAFEATQSSPTPPVFPAYDTVDGLNGKTVVVGQDRFAVHVMATTCAEPGLLPTVGGVGLAAIGGLTLLAALGWRWLRIDTD